MTVSVRDAVPGDEPSIVALIGELGDGIDYPSPITEEFARSYLECPGQYALLAEEDGQAIGLLSYGIQPDLFHAAGACLIEELVVRGPDRGRGVGRALMTGVIDRARAAGCVEVSVSVMPDNEGAQRFYRSFGLVDEAVYLEMHLPSADPSGSA